MKDLKEIYRRIMKENVLDEELTQIRELLTEIAGKGPRTFILWVQGVQSAEMTHRERLLKSLLGAGLVELDWKFTHHNAYIRASITEKGAKLTNKLMGAVTGSRSIHKI